MAISLLICKLVSSNHIFIISLVIINVNQIKAVWLHSEKFTINTDAASKMKYLASKIGNINPVSMSSCGKTTSCLVNIPSDITLSAEQPFQGLAVMHSSPISANSLNLAGDLVPLVNGAEHSGYITQLVFSESTCSDLSKLKQINMHPVYETCSQFLVDEVGKSFFTSTTFATVSNGMLVAADHYCRDSSCSNDCIYGVSWNLPSNCSSVSNNTNLYSYYLPIVRKQGLTVTGFNQYTPSATSTVAVPTPTDIFSNGAGEQLSSNFFSILLPFLL